MKKNISIVLGQIGVGKSSFINGISGKQICQVSSLKTPCTSSVVTLIDFQHENGLYEFIDTPGFDNPRGDEEIFNLIKKASSTISDIKCIIILFNLQYDKLTKSSIECLKKYMQIFNIPDFWHHVLIVYTKSYKFDSESRDKIEYTKGKFLQSLKANDNNELKNFMQKNNIKIPEYIPEFFVDSRLNLDDINIDTRTEYRNILASIRNYAPIKSY